MDTSMSSSSSFLLENGTEDVTKLENLNTLGAIMLGIFTVISFIGNVFLLSTVYSSYQLRQSIFNYFLSNISLVNLVDTCINLLLSVLYVSTGQWQLGRVACTLNSFFEQLVLIESMASVALLIVDRAIALQSIARYEERITFIRCAVMISGVWAMGGIVCTPILIGPYSEPNRYRYFCCNFADNPLGYVLSVLIIGFLIPLFIILLSLGAVFLRAHEERLRRRAMLPERLADYTDFIVDNRRIQKHMELSKYSVLVFIVYFLLQAPYIVLNYFGQIRNSVDLMERYGGRGGVITGDAETAITWLKTLFPVSFPFFTFCLYRDIWRKFKDLVCCRKTNIIAANAFSSSLQAAEVAAMAAAASTGQGALNGNGHASGVGKEMANVVTIVPTPAGIHQIRPGNDRCEYADVPQMGEGGGRRRSRDCQLQQRRPRQPSTTSDYDSAGSEGQNEHQDGQRTTVRAITHEHERMKNRDQADSMGLPSTSTDSGSSDHIMSSPNAVESGNRGKGDETRSHRNEPQTDQGAVSPGEANVNSGTEWPTIFHPKSTSAIPQKGALTNPGAVPSPEKPVWSSRRHKRTTINDPIEKTRSILDDKLKSIFHNKKTIEDKGRLVELSMDSDKTTMQAGTRRNQLPPLNIDVKTQQGQQIKENQDDDDATNTTQTENTADQEKVTKKSKAS